MIAHIDSDILVYRAGFATEKVGYKFEDNDGDIIYNRDWDLKQLQEHLKSLSVTEKDGKISKIKVYEPLEFALYLMKQSIKQILEELDVKDYRMFLTANDKSNYRFKIAKTKEYKGNRKSPKPRHYEDLRLYLIANHNAEVISGEEADDALGYNQTADSIIVSIDKDLDQIPGWHYNFVKQDRYFIEDPGLLELANNNRKLAGGGYKFFYSQMLVGDSADNIPGLAGYGPVSAYNLLQPFADERKIAELTYAEYKKNKAEDRFYEVADLLWIRREEGQLKSEELKRLLS